MKAWKNFFQKGNNDSVAVKITFAFLTTILAMIVLLNVVYFSSSQVIIEKQKNVNSNLMKLYVQNIDNILQRSDATLYELSAELARYDGYENFNIEEKLNLLNMSSLTLGTEFDFVSVYIYFKESNMIVEGNVSINSLETFADRNWLVPYNDAGFLGYSTFYIYNRTNEKTEAEVLTAIRDFPLESQTKTGALILNIERKSLFADFYENMTADEFAFICDGDGNLIFGDSELYGEYEDLMDFDPGEGVIKKINGRKMFITGLDSSYNNWKYIKVQSYSALVSELAGLKLVLALMIIIALVVMAVAFFSLNRKVYRPIASLVEKISENEVLQTELYKQYNEFEYLESAIELLVEDRKIHSSGEQSHRENSIRSILVSICADEPISAEELESVHFNPEASFTVAAVRIAAYEQVKDKAEFKNSLLGKLKAMESGELRLISGYISEDTLLSLISMSETNDHGILKEKMKQLMEETESEAEAAVSVGIGNVRAGTEGISESYREAFNALRFSVFTNRHDIIDPAEHSVPQMNVDYKETIRIEIDYVQYLKKADYDGATKCLQEIIYQMPRSASVAKNLSGLLWRFAEDIFSLMNETGISPMSAIGQSYEECYEAFLRLDSLSELENMLFALVEGFTTYSRERRENGNEDVIDSIRRYVEENFDKNISLDKISEMVHLSPNYISTLFRKQYNKSFSAYVSELKMEKAVYWLCHTDKNVDEISDRLGYANFRSFIRAFKNRYGVTPSQYRKETVLERMNQPPGGGKGE